MSKTPKSFEEWMAIEHPDIKRETYGWYSYAEAVEFGASLTPKTAPGSEDEWSELQARATACRYQNLRNAIATPKEILRLIAAARQAASPPHRPLSMLTEQLRDDPEFAAAYEAEKAKLDAEESTLTAVGEGELPELVTQGAVIPEDLVRIYLQTPETDRQTLELIERIACRERQLRDAIAQRDAEIRSHKITLDRESATTARYDTKITDLEAQRDEARARLQKAGGRLLFLEGICQHKLAEGKPEPEELERLKSFVMHSTKSPISGWRDGEWVAVREEVNAILARLRSLPSEPAGQQRGTAENGNKS